MGDPSAQWILGSPSLRCYMLDLFPKARGASWSDLLSHKCHKIQPKDDFWLGKFGPSSKQLMDSSKDPNRRYPNGVNSDVTGVPLFVMVGA